MEDIFQQLEKFESRLCIKEYYGIIHFLGCDNGIVVM